ncbi:MAG: class 1 isoprenoid biosynthesis enzyme [Dehalogenimonas sp.]
MKSAIDPPVEQLVDEFTRAWMAAAETVDLGPAFNDEGHAIRESHMDQFLGQALEELRNPPSTPDGYAALETRMLIELAHLGQSSMDLTPAQLEILLGRGIPRSLVQFSQTARGHRSLSDDEIFQASRNVAVMNVLQLLLGSPCQLTPSVVAYSLLYPYSDNYLDNPAVLLATRSEFNGRFGRRLAGENVAPSNRKEKAIFDLVETIESEKDRGRLPQVYDSLLAIQRAQSKSMDLEAMKHPRLDDVLAVTIEKGGTSVLADAFLVAENGLTPRQVRFIFSLGVFLQLVDDLQDLKQDRKRGNVTLFGLAAKNAASLESLTNRAIAFGTRVMDYLDGFTAPGIDPLKEVIHMSVTDLMIGAAAPNQELFSSEYVRRIEAHFPFRFNYIKKVRATLKKREVSFTSLLNLLTAQKA